MKEATTTPNVNPRAPKVGRLGRILGPLHVTGVFWFKLHEFGVRILPEWAKVPVIFLFSTGFSLVLWNIRRAVASNLAVVLGECGWWERQRRIFRTLHTFAWCLTERYERLSLDAPFRFEVENEEALISLLDQDNGLVFVTAHIGNWEVGAGLPAGALGRQMHLVREPELDPKAQEFIRDLVHRRLGSNFVTHFASDQLKLGITLREALHRGELVALQGDRPRTGGRTLDVPLFGHLTQLPVGPMALGRTAGAPLLPVFVVRLGRRHYRTVLGNPISVEVTHDRQADLGVAASKLAQVMERAITTWPHQWFTFREIWSIST